MPSGLHALASLDGAPLDPRDSALLGLAGANDARHAQGAILRAVDNDGADAASYAERGGGTLAFLGSLDGVAPGASPAERAFDAVTRWGMDAVAHLDGEWSFVHWDADAKVTTIAVSRAIRDDVFVATDAGRVAIAPEIAMLAELPWVGRGIDAVGFACSVGRAPLRRHAAGTTILRNVRRLEPGSVHRLDAAGTLRQVVAPPAAAPWHGSFADAVAALEDALRAAVRDAMAPHRTIAITLSGGLDSSLIARIAAEERRQDQTVFCVTSIAPEGSGLADERSYSQAVADALGLPIAFVAPDVDADPYRPDAATMLHSGGLVSPRHYLDAALMEAARDRGAAAVLCGVGGENNITRTETLIGWRSGLRLLRDLARHRLGRDGAEAEGSFHARLAPAFLARLPHAIREHGARRPAPRVLRAGTPIGMDSYTPNAPYASTAVPAGGLRHYRPFRARTLDRLVAGMPAGFTTHGGVSRALGRAMLAGHVPDAVRLRTAGIGYSPDYEARLQRHAARAAATVAGYRDGLAAAMIDLPWLRHALGQMAATGPTSTAEAFRVQMTACAAAFLDDWERQG